ncbi:hypothetical protein BKA69DRAFT_770460 [Paraphysoderma sedebokerense]|nr:hypothetical protein BKA69DRAFT_770460 [Paraphysoderma sedebokerense]
MPQPKALLPKLNLVVDAKMISSLFSSPTNPPSTTSQPMNPASRPPQSQTPPLKKSYSLKSLKDTIRYISPPIPSRGYQVYRPTLQNAAQSLENLRFEYLLRSCVMQDICDGKAPGFEGSITHELGFIENKDTSANSSSVKTLLDGCSILAYFHHLKALLDLIYRKQHPYYPPKNFSSPEVCNNRYLDLKTKVLDQLNYITQHFSESIKGAVSYKIDTNKALAWFVPPVSSADARKFAGELIWKALQYEELNGNGRGNLVLGKKVKKVIQAVLRLWNLPPLLIDLVKIEWLITMIHCAENEMHKKTIERTSGVVTVENALEIVRGAESALRTQHKRMTQSEISSLTKIMKEFSQAVMSPVISIRNSTVVETYIAIFENFEFISGYLSCSSLLNGSQFFESITAVLFEKFLVESESLSRAENPNGHVDIISSIIHLQSLLKNQITELHISPSVSHATATIITKSLLHRFLSLSADTARYFSSPEMRGLSASLSFQGHQLELIRLCEMYVKVWLMWKGWEEIGDGTPLNTGDELPSDEIWRVEFVWEGWLLSKMDDWASAMAGLLAKFESGSSAKTSDLVNFLMSIISSIRDEIPWPTDHHMFRALKQFIKIATTTITKFSESIYQSLVSQVSASPPDTFVSDNLLQNLSELFEMQSHIESIYNRCEEIIIQSGMDLNGYVSPFPYEETIVKLVISSVTSVTPNADNPTIDVYASGVKLDSVKLPIGHVFVPLTTNRSVAIVQPASNRGNRTREIMIDAQTEQTLQLDELLLHVSTERAEKDYVFWFCECVAKCVRVALDQIVTAVGEDSSNFIIKQLEKLLPFNNGNGNNSSSRGRLLNLITPRSSAGSMAEEFGTFQNSLSILGDVSSKLRTKIAASMSGPVYEYLTNYVVAKSNHSESVISKLSLINSILQSLDFNDPTGQFVHLLKYCNVDSDSLMNHVLKDFNKYASRKLESLQRPKQSIHSLSDDGRSEHYTLSRRPIISGNSCNNRQSTIKNDFRINVQKTQRLSLYRPKVETSFYTPKSISDINLAMPKPVEVKTNNPVDPEIEAILTILKARGRSQPKILDWLDEQEQREGEVLQNLRDMIEEKRKRRTFHRRPPIPFFSNETSKAQKHSSDPTPFARRTQESLRPQNKHTSHPPPVEQPYRQPHQSSHLRNDITNSVKENSAPYSSYYFPATSLSLDDIDFGKPLLDELSDLIDQDFSLTEPETSSPQSIVTTTSIESQVPTFKLNNPVVSNSTIPSDSKLPTPPSELDSTSSGRLRRSRLPLPSDIKNQMQPVAKVRTSWKENYYGQKPVENKNQFKKKLEAIIAKPPASSVYPAQTKIVRSGYFGAREE